MTEFCRWNNLKTCAHLLLLRNKPTPRVRHVDRVAWARRRRGGQARIYVQKMTRQHAVLCLQILIDCFRSKTTQTFSQKISKTSMTASYRSQTLGLFCNTRWVRPTIYWHWNLLCFLLFHDVMNENVVAKYVWHEPLRQFVWLLILLYALLMSQLNELFDWISVWRWHHEDA